MNVLLLSMPDAFEHMPPVTVRMPNGALTSLAGNVDPTHRVAVADLILVKDRVRETVEELLRSVEPAVVGLSIMTFQRRTAHALIRLIGALRPQARIVVGGYDPLSRPTKSFSDTWELVDVPRASALAYGRACAGAPGAPVIAASGSPVLGNAGFAVRLVLDRRYS